MTSPSRGTAEEAEALLAQAVSKWREGDALREEARKLEAQARAICPHATQTYQADPSGNNDWSYRCVLCGAEGRHL